MEGRRRIEVVAAIICRDGKVFATQRGYGEWKDWWEFPGGKMEPGESPREALVREIREELSASIEVGELLHTVEWDYPAFHLTMHCFLCTLAGAPCTECVPDGAPGPGSHAAPIHLNEHESARWLGPAELRSVRWLPADEGLLPLIAASIAQ